MLIDVFIDFSRVAVGFDIRAAITRLDDAELLGAIANRVTCAVALDDVPSTLKTPEGWSMVTGSPVEACRDALAAAGAEAGAGPGTGAGACPSDLSWPASSRQNSTAQAAVAVRIPPLILAPNGPCAV